MSNDEIYDVAVIGGGLAGLTLAVMQAKKGNTVILFEKEKYPFHKVCGEYISLESWDFLCNDIGLNLDKMDVPLIKRLQLTTPSGKSLHADLDLGAFGISRYLLDSELKKIAEENGVVIMEECRAEEVLFEQNIFSIQTQKGTFEAKVCCGTWGKRSNIDIKWKRFFSGKNSPRLNNYVGVKYHVTGDLPSDTIALHNFTNGYCGISKIEGNTFCLCYFMKAINLKRCGNSIARVEEEILSQNPALKEIFARITKLYEVPLTISQVSLSNKQTVENHVLMIGDAAGMISPLCGNGMSMAMHGSKSASEVVSGFLSKKISREKMEKDYALRWKKHFGARVKAGRLIQYLFEKNAVMSLLITLMKKSPLLTVKIMAFTHGKSF